MFAFGDKDGALYEAKLQHALGIALSRDEDFLYVADTYNHKLKKIQLKNNYITTIRPPKNKEAKSPNDSTDGTVSPFKEPSGLCVSSEGKIYVVDSNNHAVKVLELGGENELLTSEKLNLNLEKVGTKRTDFSKYEKVEAKRITLSPRGGKIIFKVKLSFENDLGLTGEAPQKWSVQLPNESWGCVPTRGSGVEEVDFVVNAPSYHSSEKINLLFNIVTCSINTCAPRNFVVVFPVEFVENSPESSHEEFSVEVGSKGICLG